MAGRLSIVFSVVLMLCAQPSVKASDADPVCANRYAAPPADAWDVECWLNPQDGVVDRAALLTRLQGWLEDRPGDPWVALAAAGEQVERAGKGVEAHAAAAIEIFQERGDRDGEAMAEAIRARHFHRYRRETERAASLARLRELAADGADPLIQARALLADIDLAETEARIDDAYQLAKAASLVPDFETLPRTTKLGVLLRRKNTAIQLGRYSETLALIDRSRAICGERRFCLDRDALDRARLARYMHANWQEDREVAAELTRIAYERSHGSGSHWASLIEACEAGRLTDPPESLEWFERCGQIAADLRCDDVRLVAQGLHAVGVARLDPSRIDESLARMPAIVEGLRRVGVVHEEIAGLANWSSLLRDAGRIDESLDVLRRAVALSESMHDRQLDADMRADKIAFEAKQFYDLAYQLAVAPETASAHDLGAAHEVLERFRVRASQLELRRADVGLTSEKDTEAASPLRESLAKTRAAIVGIQAQLRVTTLPDHDRDERLRELERHETEERRLVNRLARSDAESFERVTPYVASLEAVRAALEPSEALVTFQIASVPGRRPWALVVTRDEARAVALGNTPLEPALGLLTGLLSRRDGSESAALDELGAALIEPWFASLDGSLDRVVIVPDGRLFEIPISALPIERGGEPVSARVSVAVVASATEFALGRARAVARPPRAALALAHSPAVRLAATRSRDASLFAADAGALAEAASEARAVARALGAESRVLEAQSASERAVKRLHFEPFGVIHVAAHALTNHEMPGRSAIILAAGAPDEDGLLQPREIAALRLDGRLVVLAACASAAGPEVRGGGPRSLAAAFLHAGAGAVVGTLWPVRDADARRFADFFYRELAAGSTAGDALARAQRTLRERGEPTTNWGAYVLYGDARLSLPAAERAASGVSSMAGWIALVIFAVGVVGGASALIVRGRRKKPEGAAEA